MVLVCLPLAAPIGPSPLHILTLCGPERVLVVSTEPPDDLYCLTTPRVGRPRGEGGGVRAQEKACVPKTGLKFPATLINFIFLPEENVSDVGGGGRPGLGRPPPRGGFTKQWPALDTGCTAGEG